MALIGTFIVIVLLVFIRFLSRDPNTKRTKFGFFIERQRYDEDQIGEPPHSELPLSLQDDLEDTKEIPP